MSMDVNAGKDFQAVGGRQRIMSTNQAASNMVLGRENVPISDKLEVESATTEMVGGAANHMQNNLIKAPRISIQAPKKNSVTKKT
jgi:hypothetical protein